MQTTYTNLSSILYTNPALHYSFAFLAGIGIKLLLDKFYISHAKRSIGFNWRYPPVTMSVLFGLFFIVVYVYVTNNEIVEQLTAHAFVSFKFLSLSFLAAAATIIYQTKLYTEKPIFSVALCAVSAFYLFSAISLVETEQAFWVFFCIAVAYLVMSVYLLCEQLKVSSAESKVESKQEAELTLESLENFRKWFKDDSTIKNTEQLEPDLQVYATRITERLRTGGDTEGYEKRGAQHIALCGPFGCGKSSIVESIANDLANSLKQDGIWIHSDISTWGAASGSVAHVVLSHIIDDISQYIDMCAFRALPKHYTEALKSGGGLFQFASTLLAGPVDIEESFKKLNAVLETTNHKLLITLQDVDRGTGDENEKRLNDIAALLDRLRNKDLSNINFIIAMGNESDLAAEVISKATDYKEDILISNISAKLKEFIFLSINKAVSNGVITLYSSGYNTESSEPPLVYPVKDWIEDCNKFSDAFFKREVSALIGVIDSVRLLKKIIRRVDAAWNKSDLNGEVNLLATIMIVALKESKIRNYALYLNRLDEIRLNSKIDLTNVIETMSKRGGGIVDLNLINYFDVLLNVKRITDYDAVNDEDFTKGKNFPIRKLLNPISVSTQSIGNSNNEYSNYLSLIELERLPSDWLKQQPILKCLYIEDNASADIFAKNWLQSHNIRELTSELVYCPSYKANLRNIFSSILKLFANIDIRGRNALRRTRFLYNLGDIFLAATNFNSFFSDILCLINSLESDMSSKLFSYCFSRRLFGYSDELEVKFEEGDIRDMVSFVTKLSNINEEESATLTWPLCFKLGMENLKSEVAKRVRANTSSYLERQYFSNIIDYNAAYNLYVDFRTINIEASDHNLFDIPESVLDGILEGVQYD